MWNIFNRDQYEDFSYNIEDEYSEIELSTLTLHDGLHKTRYTPVSVFRCEKNKGTVSYDYAKQHLQRLKSLRHPNILTFIDSFEDENYIFIVTERVMTLLKYLKNVNENMENEYVSWGLMNVVKALDFCQRDGKFYHNNVGHNAVFVNRGGEWKLGEFGFASESDTVRFGSRAEQMMNSGIVSPGKSIEPWATDIAGLAVLIAELYSRSTLSENPLENSQRVPERLRVALSLILESKETPSAQELIVQGRRNGSFFQNVFIDRMLFLEEVHTKTQQERADFFKDFHHFIGQTPEHVAKFKILPHLVMAYEFGCEGVHLIPTLLEFFKTTDPGLDLVDFIGKLFKSNSRATRKLLLEHTDKYINKMPSTVINDVIFPHLASGFRDSSSVIRMETIKSVQHYVTKLHNNRINRELLPLLAGRLVDETNGDIRRASVETIGNMAAYIDPTNRKNVLLTVYTKAMKDVDAQTRGTAVKYLLLSQEYFTAEDMSKKILPALCCLTLDREQFVRNNVFFVLKELLAKLEDIEFPAECTEEPSPVQKTWTDWMMAALPTKLSSILLDDTTQQEEVNNSTEKERNLPMTEMIQIQNCEKQQLENRTEEGVAILSAPDKNCEEQLDKVPDKMENERKQEERAAAANNRNGNSSRRARRVPKRLAIRINHKDRIPVE